MSKYKDLTGMTFGKPVVIEKNCQKSKSGDILWICSCICKNSNPILITSSHLTSGHTTSCGCYREETRGKSSKKYNEFDINGEFGIGYTNDKIFYFDLEDFDKIKDYYWWTDNRGYISTSKSYNNKIKKTYLHRFIYNLNSENKIVIDHINHNKFDNRKENIRLTNDSNNNKNTTLKKNNNSGIIGVHYATRDKKWVAKIRLDYNDIYLGGYENKKDAIIARLDAEQKYFGEFAPQKHLMEQYKF